MSHSKGVHSDPPKMDTSAITTSAHIARTYRRIFMFSMSKIGEDMCLSARMPSVDKVEKSQ